MGKRRWWPAMMAFMLVPHIAEAQNAITGELIDSLRVGGPIAGAEVLLLGTGRKAFTDRGGRFEFSGLSSGEYTVAYWAPWLDSLGVGPIRTKTRVDDAVTTHVVLSTPAAGSVQAALCGAELADGSAVILGEVRDPSLFPVANSRVRARWEERVLGKGVNHVRRLELVDTSDAAGIFVLCGAPRGAVLSLIAVRGDSTFAWASVRADRALIRSDMTLGSSSLLSAVSGRVLSQLGEPVAGADIRLLQDSAVFTKSDSTGVFALLIPSRTSQLVVRSLGFAPIVYTFDPSANRAGSGAVELGDLRLEGVQLLPEIPVDARALSRERLEFEERRRFNFQGTFFTDDELSRLPLIRPSILASKVPRSMLTKGGEFVLAYNGGWCKPRVFVDGGDFGADQSALHFWLQRARRVEVYRAAFAPARFTDFDGCGSVVISTR